MGQDETVSHVVVMGIGEPFDNFKNLLDFLNVINDHKGLAIAADILPYQPAALPIKLMNSLIPNCR